MLKVPTFLVHILNDPEKILKSIKFLEKKNEHPSENLAIGTLMSQQKNQKN